MYQSRCGLSQAVILQKSLYGTKADRKKSTKFAGLCIWEIERFLIVLWRNAESPVPAEAMEKRDISRLYRISRLCQDIYIVESD
jgi:hypothetical protein